MVIRNDPESILKCSVRWNL